MLLERDGDIRALNDALQRVTASGRGEIALVGAEAGGGKTSLVRAFADAADAALWWGLCDNNVHDPERRRDLMQETFARALAKLAPLRA